ncbi:MAG TPA: hypothetical protein VFD38_05900 [Myxococcaceae bacterium]|nr:hypothetical protein [Myxococcaceae bacterium]
MARRSFLVLTWSLVSAAALAPQNVHAYPIAPVTLWELIERSPLIVLAEVERVSQHEPTEDDWNSSVAHLRVLETWKGRVLERVEVPYPANMICPAPPVYDPGHRVIAFLTRENGPFSTVGLSYGTRYPETRDDEVAYRDAVRGALSIMSAQRGESVPPAARRAWQLGLVAHEATRWDGLYGLEPAADERHARYDGREPPAPLSVEERRTLAKAFVSAPPVDGTLPVMLRALRSLEDPAITAAAVDAYESVLQAHHFPWWAKEVLPLIAERLGQRPDSGAVSWIAQTVEDAATAAWSLHAADAEEEVQRAWFELKTRHRLVPHPLPHAPEENWKRPVGGNSSL